METIFLIIIFVYSAVVHEVSHGYMADKLGDPTARLQGRLTLNPLRHLDPVGSVILPAILILSHAGFVFGWAKPVPFNPYHLKNPERDAAIIALAGPASNFFLAIVFGALIRVSALFAEAAPILVSAIPLFAIVIQVNIVLAVFNLVPIPPLDGSKILFALLPRSLGNLKTRLEQIGPILLLAFIVFGIGILSPVVSFLFRLLV